ncbi:organic cation transporter protein [Pocillopora verrucosa]|uniref:organic cation transporter protein n=1 Tax=Pocillopora verrucosa TaxID=203993 RepID=UPI002797B790|nr:organic cation transporter protein-like [Pocillopora verrucosa]
MALTADEVLIKIGSFGRYQFRLLIFANVLGFFWLAWPMLINTFITAEPGWRCVANSTECQMDGIVYTEDDNYNLRCNMSRAAWEFVGEYTSVVTQFDLVCDKAIYGTVSSSLLFLGSLTGAAAVSTLSDKFGRRIITFTTGFLISLFSLLSAFSNSYWLFTLFRFIVGFNLGGIVAIYILISEFVGVRHRAMMGTSLWYSWTISLMSLAGIAYLIPDWRSLCIVTGAPAIPLALGFLITPESLRWLIVKGKTKEATNLCSRIARVNGKNISMEEIKLEEIREERMGDIRDLFVSRKMAIKTVITWYCWFANAMVYYGVFMSAPYIGGSMHFNFFLASVTELPAITAGIWIYNRFGRKKGVMIPMILTAIGAAVSVLLTTDDESNKGFFVGKIIMSLVWAKFWIMISFDGLYVYTTELFPTAIRNIALGTSEAAAGIGSFSSSYVIYTQRIHPIFPYGIMGLNALVAALLSMYLDETRYKPTLETVERSEKNSEKDVDPSQAATLLPHNPDV